MSFRKNSKQANKSKKNNNTLETSSGPSLKTRRALTIVTASAILLIAVAALGPSISNKNLWDPILNAFAVEKQDPFEKDTWHAIGETWPGTIEFDGEAKQVILKPLGAPVIEATYKFDIEHSNSRDLNKSDLIEGSLAMRNTEGQQSLSNFKIIDGDKLHLTYSSGQRPEQYVRLDQEGVDLQKEQIEKMLREGEVNTIPVPPVLQQ